MAQRLSLCGAVALGSVAGFGSSLSAATPQDAAAPGAVLDLRFEATSDGRAWRIAWRPPADTVAPEHLVYEVQDRGAGPWRAVHRGGEVALRILEPRSGPCTVRVRAIDPDLQPGPWTETDCRIAFDAPVSTAAVCDDTDHAACLEARFLVSVTEHEVTDGHAERLQATGTFRFADETRSVRIAIIDDCTTRNYFGIEYESWTRRAFLVRVTDTQTAQSRSFLAPVGTDRPPRVRYTEVFDC